MSTATAGAAELLANIFADTPKAALAMVVDVRERSVICRQTREEAHHFLSISQAGSSGEDSGGAPSTTTAVKLPPQQLIELYVSLVVAAAEVFDGRVGGSSTSHSANEEWTVLRFRTAHWDIVAYRAIPLVTAESSPGGKCAPPWAMVVFAHP